MTSQFARWPYPGGVRISLRRFNYSRCAPYVKAAQQSGNNYPTHSFIHSFIHKRVSKIGVTPVCHRYPNPRNKANESLTSRANLLLAPDAGLMATRQCLSPCFPCLPRINQIRSLFKRLPPLPYSNPENSSLPGFPNYNRVPTDSSLLTHASSNPCIRLNLYSALSGIARTSATVTYGST